MYKEETKFWHEIRKHKSKISWTRLENSAAHGTPDLLGYNDNSTFFTVELKLKKVKKISFSPHQIAFHVKHPTNTYILATTHDQSTPILYPGSAIQELAACGLALEACRLPLAAWSELEASLLLAA